MRGDLPIKLYDGDAGIACDGPSPGASAQSRYVAKIIDTRCNFFGNSSISWRNPGDISPENDGKLLWF
jgi:hypothetical protein